MPLARIDLPRGKSPEYRRTLGDVVYEAMIQTINVPANDRFQIITEHRRRSSSSTGRTRHRAHRRLRDDPGLPQRGSTTELKKAFYRAIADGLHQRLGLRKQDVFITLVEVKKENWSFGNGEAQYA
jgi:phenylpyruvate tautomerase PptA (4-oxalocrotonate tautomerase family)